MKRKKRKENLGQGLTEYIIILALVAIAAIGIVNIFGNQVRHQFHAIVSALAGHRQQVEDLSGKSKKETNVRTLKNYASENSR